MSKQVFECPECKAMVVYDPSTVIVSLNEHKGSKQSAGKEVVAYLTCHNGHTKPYLVKK